MFDDVRARELKEEIYSQLLPQALLKSDKKKRKLRHHMKKEKEAVFKSGRSVEKSKFRDQKRKKWSLKKTSRGKS